MRLFLIGSQLFTHLVMWRACRRISTLSYSITSLFNIIVAIFMIANYPSIIPNLTCHLSLIQSETEAIAPPSKIRLQCFTVSMTDQLMIQSQVILLYYTCDSMNFIWQTTTKDRPIGLLLYCTIILFLIEEGGWRSDRMTVTLFYKCNWKLFNSQHIRVTWLLDLNPEK